MNKLGQGLAVGLTGIGAAVVACVGLCCGASVNIVSVMVAPAAVALFIMLGDGWE